MTTDKSELLTASIRLLNEKLHFEGKVDGNEPISIDYTPPLGDNLGYILYLNDSPQIKATTGYFEAFNSA